MTTRVTITNEGVGDAELVFPDGEVHRTLKPGESHEVWIWHDGRELDGRELRAREKSKAA